MTAMREHYRVRPDIDGPDHLAQTVEISMDDEGGLVTRPLDTPDKCRNCPLADRCDGDSWFDGEFEHPCED